MFGCINLGKGGGGHERFGGRWLMLVDPMFRFKEGGTPLENVFKFTVCPLDKIEVVADGDNPRFDWPCIGLVFGGGEEKQGSIGWPDLGGGTLNNGGGTERLMEVMFGATAANRLSDVISLVFIFSNEKFGCWLMEMLLAGTAEDVEFEHGGGAEKTGNVLTSDEFDDREDTVKLITFEDWLSPDLKWEFPAL